MPDIIQNIKRKLTMFRKREEQAADVLEKYDAQTLLRDLLLSTRDHEERVRIIDRVRRQCPQMISKIYEYLESGTKFKMPPDAVHDVGRKAEVINELENAMLKQAFETKTEVDLAVYSPRPGRNN
jgi:hypothetical protein